MDQPPFITYCDKSSTPSTQHALASAHRRTAFKKDHHHG
jgi:hypothetical protein